MVRLLFNRSLVKATPYNDERYTFALTTYTECNHNSVSEHEKILYECCGGVLSLHDLA